MHNLCLILPLPRFSQASHGQGKVRENGKQRNQGQGNVKEFQIWSGKFKMFAKVREKVMNFKNVHMFGSQVILTVHKYMLFNVFKL